MPVRRRRMTHEDRAEWEYERQGALKHGIDIGKPVNIFDAFRKAGLRPKRGAMKKGAVDILTDFEPIPKTKRVVRKRRVRRVRKRRVKKTSS